MLDVYPSQLNKPSGIADGIPNSFTRPTFGELYGFDVPQGDVIDGALFTEDGETMITEDNEILLFN